MMAGTDDAQAHVGDERHQTSNAVAHAQARRPSTTWQSSPGDR